jgi:hypothetical protein
MHGPAGDLDRGPDTERVTEEPGEGQAPSLLDAARRGRADGDGARQRLRLARHGEQRDRQAQREGNEQSRHGAAASYHAAGPQQICSLPERSTLERPMSARGTTPPGPAVTIRVHS